MEHRAGSVLGGKWDMHADYVMTPLPAILEVTALISVHYFEYTSDFYFPGEAHDFWELVYVDKGEVIATAGSTEHALKAGDMIFHQPMEFHCLKANGTIAPNLIVIGFECRSSAMRYFEGKTLRLDSLQSDLLAKILLEARQTYASALDQPALLQLEKREGIPFGAEQMIRMGLEQLLILLVRQGMRYDAAVSRQTSIQREYGRQQVRQVTQYLQQNIRNNLTLGQICKNSAMGRSHLQKLFRRQYQCGVMEYFSMLKMEAAKNMIREGKLNFTQIAEDLGFNSVHYFSRRFKQLIGMTPTEYASSAKIRSEQAGAMGLSG